MPHLWIWPSLPGYLGAGLPNQPATGLPIEIRAALGREKGAITTGSEEYYGRSAQIRFRIFLDRQGNLVEKPRGIIKSEGGDESWQEAEIETAEVDERGGRWRVYLRGPEKPDRRNVRDYAWIEFPNLKSLADEAQFKVARAHYNRTNRPKNQKLPGEAGFSG